MKIGIDIRPISVGASGGIFQHLKGVLNRLFEEYSGDQYYLFTTIYNNNIFNSLPDNVQKFSLSTINFYQEVDRIGKEEGIDILFRSFPNDDCLEFPLSRQIFLVPDLQHETFPEFFTKEVLRLRRLNFNKALSGAGCIVTSCDFSIKAIKNHPWTNCCDISIACPALQDEHKFVAIDELELKEKKLIPENDFFYFPANLWPHKNHRRMFESFRMFTEGCGFEVSLVLTGHPEDWEELQVDYADLPIRHLGYVSSSLVQVLMQKATALVFFSQYEGFGIPLLEAFQAGTPVICSNTTSLPEVGRDAVLYSDPTDIEGMASAMTKIYNDKSLRLQLITKGKERLSLFTWDESAKNLHDACHRLKRKFDANGSEKSTPDFRLDVNETPLVSIVTPSYNQGPFLQRTIESVLSQDYSNIEYFVMDGGSQDESVDILKSYGNKFTWVSEPDNGQTHAINKGFAQAKGKILGYLNSDDVIYPQTVSTIVDHFKRNPACDMVYGRADYLDKNDNITGSYNTAHYSFERNMHDCCICQPACFWQKRIADLVGPFDEKLNFGMDYDYWLRADRAGGNIHHIWDVLAGSRLYSETKTLSAREEVYGETFHVCRKHGGYVGLSYFQGLWHHRLRQKKTVLSALLKSIPSSYKHFAQIHHKLCYQNDLSFKELSRKITRKLFMKSNLLSKHANHKVRGFYPDNWLAPESIFRVKGIKNYYLTGFSPIGMELKVSLNGKIYQTTTLEANVRKTIMIEIGLDGSCELQLKFSQYVTDSAGRSLTFLIESTNLFVEENLY